MPEHVLSKKAKGREVWGVVDPGREAAILGQVAGRPVRELDLALTLDDLELLAAWAHEARGQLHRALQLKRVRAMMGGEPPQPPADGPT